MAAIDEEDDMQDGFPDDNDEEPSIDMCVAGRVGHCAILRGRKIVTWGGYTRLSRIKPHFLVIDMDTGKKEIFIPVVNDQHRFPFVPLTGRNLVLATCYSASAYLVCDNVLLTFGGHSLLTNRTVNYVFSFRFVANNPNHGKLNRPGASMPAGEFIEWTLLDFNMDPHPRRPSPRDKHTVFLFDNKICTFGGYGPKMTLGYLNDHGEWHSSHDLFDDRGWNNQFLTFDLRTRLWENVKTTGAVPCPRAAHDMCLLGTRAFLFGGRSAPSRLNDIYQLDMLSMQWSEIHPTGTIPCQRSWATLTPVDASNILIFGGMDNKRDVVGDAFVLDVTSHRCRQLQLSSQVDTHRLWHVTLLTDDKRVLVVGGCATSIYSNSPVYPGTFLQMRLHTPSSLYHLALRFVAKHFERFEGRAADVLNHFVLRDVAKHRSLFPRREAF